MSTLRESRASLMTKNADTETIIRNIRESEAVSSASGECSELAIRCHLVRLVVESCRRAPEPLPVIYDFVQTFRREAAEETIRARIYESVERGKVVRVARGVYFARSGPAQLLMIEGDAWDVMTNMSDDSIDAKVTDPPGKFGREWAGKGTTRPHSHLGGRTYRQPDLDSDFMRQAFQILKKSREWNTLSNARKAIGSFPRGGAPLA